MILKLLLTVGEDRIKEPPTSNKRRNSLISLKKEKKLNSAFKVCSKYEHIPLSKPLKSSVKYVMYLLITYIPCLLSLARDHFRPLWSLYISFICYFCNNKWKGKTNNMLVY